MKKFLLSLGVAVTTLSSVQAQSSLLYQLEAFYPLAGSAQDVIGSNHGQVMGGVSAAPDRNAQMGGAYAFDGFTGYVDLGNSLDSVFSGPSAQFSISAWVKLDNANYNWTYNRLILNKSADSGCNEGQQQFYFRYYNGALNFSYAGIGASFARYINSSFAINDTLWHHVAATYDGTQAGNNGLDRVKMYADGVLLTNTLLPISFGPLGDIQSGTGHLGIGNRLGSTGQPCQTFDVPGFFKGGIDDVAIYSRALTATDVSQLAMPLRNGPLATGADVAGSQLHLFPTRSATGLFTVSQGSSAPVSYEVINSLGQRVAFGALPATPESELNLGSLTAGMYYIRLVREDESILRKVIRE